LLEALEHTGDDEGSSVSAYAYELREVIVDSGDFGFPAGLGGLRDISVACCVFFLHDFFFDLPQDAIDHDFHALTSTNTIHFPQDSSCLLFFPCFDKIARRLR
jgi:hypothetical protein